MKKIIFAAMLFVAVSALAATEKTVSSSVKKVNVFTQSAQVFRSSTVTLPRGVTDLVFSGISPFVNASSVQAGGKGNFVILEVKHRIKYPEPPNPDDGTLPLKIQMEIKSTEDSISELGFVLDELMEHKNALLLEKEMILKNKLSRGEGKSDSLAVLKQAMEFFRLKLNDINAQLTRIKRNERLNGVSVERLTARLDNLKTYKNNKDPKIKYEPVHEVVMTVSADEATNASVEINYMVTQAGWTPFYDLRSNTVSGPVQLTYNANVYQNCGEDWNDVKIKLSTGNPNRSNIKPDLQPWYINYFTAKRDMKYPASAREKLAGNTSATNEELDAEKKDLDEMSPAQYASSYSQMIETMTNVEFEIKLSYSIPSDGINHLVSIMQNDLSADYYHFLVPKLDREAFLIAKVTGWEALNLLPGRANVFFEGTYVGETVLNPLVMNDTLELALGRDQGITVTRTRLPVKENNKLLGNEVTKTITYELRMKNNKSKAVNLIVEDQIPVTQNKEIKVEMKDSGKSEYNEKSGLLRWNATIGTKEYKTFTFTYAVTYDKGLPLSMF